MEYTTSALLEFLAGGHPASRATLSVEGAG
jgi:hypothetical protein